MIRRSLVMLTLLVAAGAVGPAELANAKQKQVHVGGRELVVHSRTLPVLVHRALPPFWGKHVSQRQLNAGRLPPGAKR